MKSGLLKSTSNTAASTIQSLWPSDLQSSQVLLVKRYLQELYNQDLLEGAVSFKRFPSVTAIALGLRCSTVEVYAALKELKTEGYRYRISADGKSLILWDVLSQ